MARKIRSRLKINGTMVAKTPLHIGGHGDSPDTDLPLAQNGRGEWYVPGTSITGVLRNWCEKNLSPLLIAELFAPKRKPGIEEGHASFILIEDATIDNAEKVLSEIRDGVGIDRFYGVAADKAKYDRAILPRGTQLNFEMRVEIGEHHTLDQIRSIVGYLLEAFQGEQIRFGASKTRGLGRVKLDNIAIKEQSFIGFDILNTLNDGGTLLTIEELKNDSVKPNASAKLEIKINWMPRLPVMVKAGYDGIGVDMLPLTSGVKDGEVALCLPGSSIKGAIRTHAERIVRTLLDCENRKARFRTKEKEKFNDQIDSIPLVEELFGARSKSDKEKQSANTKKHLGLGALAVDDCYAKEIHSENGKEESFWMNAKQWREVEVAIDGKKREGEQHRTDEVSYYQRELWKRLREIDEVMGILKGEDEKYKSDTRRFRINHHVAIDRWTGGASEGALYSVLSPAKVEWEEMRLTLDFDRLKDVELPVLMLLLLTLRDMAENRLPFGFATNRGMGEIEVKKIEIKGQGLSDELKELTNFETNGRFVELSKNLKDKLKEEWEQWRKSNQSS